MAIRIKLLDGYESIIDSESVAQSDALRDIIQNSLETKDTADLIDKALHLKRMSRVLANKGFDWDERERYEREFNRLADEITVSTSFSYMGREGLVDLNPPDYSTEARRLRDRLMRDTELSPSDYQRMSSEIHRHQELSGTDLRRPGEYPQRHRNIDSSPDRDGDRAVRSHRRNNNEPEKR